jgi:hypothetical protein
MFTLDRIHSYFRLPVRTRRWHLALVCLFLMILAGGSEILRRTAGAEPEPGSPYMSLVDTRLEVIYAGSSHFGYGIDPRRYDLNGMNITAGALNYEGIEIVLRRYLDQAPNLKVLVVEAGIVPLRVDTMARLDGDYRSLYRLGLETFDLPIGPYEKIIQWLRESRILYPVYFMERWSPSLLVWGTRPLGGEGEGNVDTRGFTPLERSITNANDGAVVVNIHRLDHLRTDHSKCNLPALLRILELAEARRLPVVLLRPPHHRTYTENRPPEWERQFQDMISGATAQVIPELITVLDWEQHPAFRDEHFADGDHLNAHGVQLLRDLLNPILLGKTRD